MSMRVILQAGQRRGVMQGCGGAHGSSVLQLLPAKCAYATMVAGAAVAASLLLLFAGRQEAVVTVIVLPCCAPPILLHFIAAVVAGFAAGGTVWVGIPLHILCTGQWVRCRHDTVVRT